MRFLQSIYFLLKIWYNFFRIDKIGMVIMMDVNYANQVLILYLKEINSLLKRIEFKDGFLSLGSETINIIDFDMRTIFTNNYNLKNDVEKMEVEDFFNVVRIHALTDKQKKEANVLQRNDVKIIKEDDFYKLINSSNDLTTEEQKQVNYFNAYLGDIMNYEDYLNNDVVKILNRFKRTMEYLETSDLPLTNNQQHEMKNYQEMVDKRIKKISQEDLVNQLKLIKDKKTDTMLGYVNIFLILLFIIGFGMVVGSMLFLKFN